jgi:hypothetical protein
MDITYHGNSCVSITVKQLSGEVNVVLDPYENSTGLRMSKTVSADVVFSSEDGDVHGNRAAVQGDPFVIETPGEYEIKGVMFDSRRTSKNGKRQMILRIYGEGMTVGFLGGLNRALSDEELELLEGVDILILPTGGESVMTPKIAAEVLRAVEPRVVIPVMVEEKGLKEKLEPISAFKKELGSIRTEEANKFKITKAKLPQDDMLLVELSRQ